jgi:nitrous oxide reductase accessory protein NosL
MILSDERCAAALLIDGNQSDGQQSLLFDDIGDMVEYEHSHSGLKVKKEFVHDFQTRQWLPASAATYMISEEIQTPMGSGIVAFASADRARASSAENSGKVSDRSGLAAAISPSTLP